ncbi:MAG TPA: hypothetical protein VFX97_05440 [Pyrinomonadaceae bacterium]|nr:hypothetical protein [Pyrinomonadaceae bacterium]
MPNPAPQYKQFARVGGFALEHEGHGTSSLAVNARGACVDSTLSVSI